MSSGPALYVRFWGMIDVFILTTVVFLVSYQDSSSDVSREQGQRIELQAKTASLEDEAAVLQRKLSDAEAERDKSEQGRKALAGQLRDERESKAALAKDIKQFDSAEALQRYVQLKNMTTVLDLKLADTSCVLLDTQNFPAERFQMLSKEIDEITHEVGTKVDKGKLQELIQSLDSVLRSKRSSTLTIIMLTYTGSSSSQLRESLRSELDRHLADFSKANGGTVVATAWVQQGTGKDG